MIVRNALTAIAIGAIFALQSLSANSFFPENPSLMLPERSHFASSGQEFSQQLNHLSANEREEEILRQALSGNVPYFLRELVPITLSFGGEHEIRQLTFWTTSDYFAIGTEYDYLRVPMNLHTAQTLAGRLNCILPTAKMVDLIYQNAEHRLAPRPMKPGRSMTTAAYYTKHNDLINQQLHRRMVFNGDLIAGHKKDVVMSKKLNRKPQAIAIYGWHRPNGKAIQPLSTVHGASYADYSHGIRLIHKMVEVITQDGSVQQVSIEDLLTHPQYASLLSDEGPLPQQLKAFQAPKNRTAMGRI